MSTDPRVDAYVATAPAYALPIFAHVRALVHAAIPAIDEGIKWGKPAWLYRGKNVATFAAFKAHAIFVIHGEGRQGEGEAETGKITCLADLPGDNALKSALVAAAERIDAEGSALRKRPAAARVAKPELPVPAEFAAALADHPDAAANLAALAPSHRREYLEWIGAAKRDETRARRIATALAQLAEGKKLNWKYEAC